MFSEEKDTRVVAVLSELEADALERFRNIALLTLTQQIACCEDVIKMWSRTGNLSSAESCAHIAINLKREKFGYYSTEVALAILALADINYLQCDKLGALRAVNEADAIVNRLEMRTSKTSARKMLQAAEHVGTRHRTVLADTKYVQRQYELPLGVARSHYPNNECRLLAKRSDN
jgi:hypothetical protein